MKDLIKVSDALDDLVEQGEEMIAAIKSINTVTPVVGILTDLVAAIKKQPAIPPAKVEITVPPANVTVEETARGSWRFSIERDREGRITNLLATPVK